MTNPAAILQALVELLVGGLTQMGSGIASGVNAFVTGLAVTGTGSEQTISVFLATVGIFGGIALAVGLTRRIFAWIQSLGAR